MKKNIENTNRVLVCAENPDTLPDLCDGGASIWGPIIGATIAGGASAASAGIAAGSKWGSSTYMRVAKEMARYNQAQNEDLYNRYQSPKAMMAQYKEAGLNPYLVYSQANPGAPAAGQVSTNPQDYESNRKGEMAQAAAAAIGNSINQYQTMLSNQQALENSKQQLDYMAAQTQLVQSRADHQQFVNSKQEDIHNLDVAIKSTKLESDALKLLVDKEFSYKKEEAKYNEQLQNLQHKKNINEKDKIDMQYLQEKIGFVQDQREMIKTRIGFIKFQQDLSNKKYQLDLTKLANQNYWNGVNARLKASGIKMNAAKTAFDARYKAETMRQNQSNFEAKMELAKEAAAAGLAYKTFKYLDQSGDLKESMRFNSDWKVPNPSQMKSYNVPRLPAKMIML